MTIIRLAVRASKIGMLGGVLFGFVGCKPENRIVWDDELAEVAIRPGNLDARKAAIDKIIDQSQLAEVVIRGKNAEVIQRALRKITVQSCLVDVVARSQDNAIRKAALDQISERQSLEKVIYLTAEPELSWLAFSRLNDPEFLLNLANNDSNSMEKALGLLKRISDIDSLTRIATGSHYLGAAKSKNGHALRASAVSQIADANRCASLAIESTDPTFAFDAYKSWSTHGTAPLKEGPLDNAKTLGLVYKVCSALPTEHRDRLGKKTLLFVKTLQDSRIVDELGELEDMTASWSRTREEYHGNHQVLGERFQLSIKLKKMRRPVDVSWETEFPKFVEIGTKFLPAIPDYDEPLMAPAGSGEDVSFITHFCPYLSNQYRLAISASPPYTVLDFAVARYTERQKSSANEANNKKNPWQMRVLAVRRIWDLRLLNEVKRESTEEYIQREVAQRLTEIDAYK